MGWNKALPVGATSVLSSTTTMTGNYAAIEAYTNLEHDGVVCASYGSHKPGGVTALYVNSAINIAALTTTAACAVAFDTTSYELRYNDGGTFTYIGGFVPSGATMIFYQDTAPTGWTIEDTLDTKLIYITKGSVLGGKAGGIVHNTGTWTRPTHRHNDTGTVLTTSTIPAHSHASGLAAGSCGTAVSGFPGPRGSYSAVVQSTTLNPCGDGQPHYHGATSADNAVTTWRPAAYCCIFATKK